MKTIKITRMHRVQHTHRLTPSVSRHCVRPWLNGDGVWAHVCGLSLQGSNSPDPHAEHGTWNATVITINPMYRLLRSAYLSLIQICCRGGGQSFETGSMTQATPFPATSVIPRQIHYILSLFAKFKVTIGLSHSQVVEESQIRLQQNYRQSTTALQS